MDSARVWTFGYNTDFSSRSNRDITASISGIAQELLFCMKSAGNENRKGPPFGQNPIILVAHSLGGIVAKKAYMLGWKDDFYEQIIRSIRGILFMATPHRGCHFPETLNNLLLATLGDQISEQHIHELSGGVGALKAIDEQWQALSPNLSLISLYETLPTSIGATRIKVLDQQISAMCCSGETTKGLKADHINVCRYSDRHDPNYAIVRDILKHTVAKHQSKKLTTSRSVVSDSTEGGTENLEGFLGTMDALQNDLEFFSEKQMVQSCQWFLDTLQYLEFIDNPSKSGILWCTGPPGFGKSVLCSSVVQNLLDEGERVAYHFFRFGDHSKNNVSKMLASIAYQTAIAMPIYRKTCIRIAKQATSIRNMSTRSLWQKLYADTLLKLHDQRPLYIVIDGLDECDEAIVLLKYLQGIKSSTLAIKVIIFSRKTHELQQSIEKMSRAMTITSMDLSKNNVDLRNYINEEMEDVPGDDDHKSRVREQLLRKSQGNFLWTSLVINELRDCHTPESVEEALSSVPTGLEELYYRMNSTLDKRLRDRDHRLARDIFEWIVCAKRALSLEELQEALSPDHGRLLDLAYTVGKMCGDFVVIDGKNMVSMIHLTAKDFLLQNPDLRFHISEKETHHKLMLKCLTMIQAYETQMSRGPARITAFVQYAATSWSFHLQKSITEADQDSSAVLTHFFSESCVLTWIYLLAAANQLKVLVHAAKVVTSFIRQSKKLDEDRNPMVHRLQEREILTTWSTDLLRIVGKFSPQLTSNPKLIFSLIPPFCPPDSAIRQQFGTSDDRQRLEIGGLASTTWDDCVAKFAAPNGQTPLALRCSSQYLAMLLRDGTVVLYYSDTLQEARTVSHGDRVSAWAFNRLGDRLVTSSMSHTTAWNPLTAEDIVTISHEGRIKPLTISFAENDSSLVICTDDRKVQRVRLNLNGFEDSEADDDNDSLAGDTFYSSTSTRALEDTPKWQVLEGALGPDVVDGKHLASPRCVEFDSSGTLVAVFYREFQLSVWSLQESLPNFVGTCQRSYSSEELHDGANMVIQSICWNDATGHVLGMDRETKCVFKWHPYSGEYAQSNQIPVGTISCSGDGKIFVTGSQDGSIRIWDFQHLSVIYQLSCNILVTDLTVDPEGLRVYDIRETYCSVWNPNSLIRMWEVDDSTSDVMSSHESSAPSSLFSESSHVVSQAITSLALCGETFSFATGDDKGNVTHFSPEGERLHVLGKGFMTIGPMCWSIDGSRIAYADLARQILVESLNALESHTPASNILRMKETMRAGTLLFSTDSQKLLVASETEIKIWSIEQKQRIASIPHMEPTIWVCDPLGDEVIFGFGASNAYVASWDHLSEIEHIPLRDHVQHQSLPETSPTTSSSNAHQTAVKSKNVISKAMLTIDGSEILLQITTASSRQRRNQWIMLNIPNLRNHEVSSWPLPSALQERLSIPLGFVASEATDPGPRRPSLVSNSERRRSSAYGISAKNVRSPSPQKRPTEHVLVFLDLDYWVCSCNISSNTGKSRIKRHFFLPRDWLNARALEMAVVTPEGTFLCPKNGEVAAVTHGLRQEWVD